jgi:PEP-CTERM motif-containing protein
VRVDPAGSVTFAPGATLAQISTGVLQFQLSGATLGAGYGQATDAGSLTLGGQLQVAFTNGFDSTVNSSESFTLLDAAGGLSGTFANVANGTRLLTNDDLHTFLVNYGSDTVVLSDEYTLSSPLAPATSTGLASGSGTMATVTPNPGGPGTVTASFTSNSSGTLSVSYNEVSETDFDSAVASIDGAGQVNFQLPGAGNQVQVWYVADTGNFTGPVTLVFQYDPAGLSIAQQDALYIEHYTGGEWVDIFGTVDTADDTITVTTDSFSPFALGGPQSVPEPASFSMLGIGSVALLRRNRRSARSVIAD